ncbi:Bacteriophage abortive infection AbiH [Ruminococcus flavefaciens]|uniref:Bacteriophage abortive infection AbiH n=1 Tax=Ruminococcus flavefaciens TaxID=1265 RepID=A0A1H6L1R7_RUMFL|nr:AbiH family protein [Ruminococcus flavefaciens]SEH78239.1 Bacteriophage abortive infection AbiH [Ruminococcus flavefaciens]
MNILVIGNGFDLAHGLPTKYQDFLKFAQYLNLYLIDNDDDEFNYDQLVRTYGDDTDNKYYDYIANLDSNLWQEYYDLIIDNVWFKHFHKQYDKKLKNKVNWIDFEAEIADVVQELDRIRKVLLNTKGITNDRIHTKIDTEYEIIENISQPLGSGFSLSENAFSLQRVSTIKNELFNDLNKLIRCLELYLTDFLDECFDYDKCTPIEPFKSTRFDHVLNFNYTNTYIKLYTPHLTGKFENGFCNYIHGKAKKENTIENCNLVLGIGEYLKGDEKDNDNEYIEFKKFYQRIFKGTGSAYTRWLNKELLPKDVIDPEKRIHTYIYGHSLATTDEDIIKNLIRKSDKTTIYYYRKSDLHDIILNLVQIIGEEELIDRTADEHRSIIFKPNP